MPRVRPRQAPAERHRNVPEPGVGLLHRNTRGTHLAIRMLLVAVVSAVGIAHPLVQALARPEPASPPRFATTLEPLVSRATGLSVVAASALASDAAALQQLQEPSPKLRAMDPAGDHSRKWTPKLDRYLEGSPLAGHGDDFARAAYRYGIDPRLSASIAMNESGLGRHNAGPHNAWGVRSGSGWKSWGSWESAIDAHASLIARVYGKGSTPESMGPKYCPGTASHWAGVVRGQMGRIR